MTAAATHSPAAVRAFVLTLPEANERASHGMPTFWLRIRRRLPPYVGRRGWVGVRLDTTTGWNIVRDVLVDAFCAVAPQRLIVLCHAVGTET